MQSRPRLASIDIGTNSVRLLVAERGPRGGLVVRTRQGAITRLGEGLGRSGVIAAAAWDRTREAVQTFAEEAEYEGAETVVVIGTSARRLAAIGADAPALTPRASWTAMPMRLFEALSGGGEVGMVLSGGIPTTGRVLYAVREWARGARRASPLRTAP